MKKVWPFGGLRGILLVQTLLLSPIGCSESADTDTGDTGVDTDTAVDTDPDTGTDTDVDTGVDTDSDTSNGLTIPEIMAAQGVINIEEVSVLDPVTGETFTGYQGDYADKWTAGTNEKGAVVGYDPNEPGHEGDDMNRNPKKCLVATGTPFAVGYQIGMLAAPELYEMSTTFIKGALIDQFALLGIDVDPESETGTSIFNFFHKQLYESGEHSWEHAGEPGEIPAYIRREVEGLLAGAATQDYYPEKIDVFAISQGIDAAFCFVFSLLGYSDMDEKAMAKRRENLDLLRVLLEEPENAKFKEAIQITDDYQVLLPKIKDRKDPPPRFGCNHLVASGEAAVDGHTLQGRDFMFSTGSGVYAESSRIAVYLPKVGDGEFTGYPEGSIPFAAVSAPGFVGQTCGVNIEGVGVGVDISITEAIDDDPGVGALIVVRDMVQRGHSIEDAIGIVKGFRRGFPWAFPVADDDPHPEHGHGAILEVGRSGEWLGTDMLSFAKENTLFSRLTGDYSLLNYEDKKAEALAMLDLPPHNGVNARGSKWQPSPIVYETVNNLKEGMAYKIEPNEETGFEPNPLYPGLPYDYDNYLFFPEQKETSDDILVLANHNLFPHQRIAQMGPLLNILYGTGQLAESVFRYEATLDLMDGQHDADLRYDPALGFKMAFFGDLDPTAPNYPNQLDRPAPFTAAWITDLLNINRDVDGVDYNTGFYNQIGREGDHIVEGLHATYDNTDKLLMGLFGYMDDPWVGVDLKPFGEYWNTHFCD
ncbi:MAG: hypothetical protein QNJ97_02030 [Myxococcota bacterium]|nr:hypothetical protein [Myxococcota bacterium]